MRSSFRIDPTKPIRRGPGVPYECLRCGDIVPSVERPHGPCHCRCYAIKLDHDAHRASFAHPEGARGIVDGPGEVPTSPS